MKRLLLALALVACAAPEDETPDAGRVYERTLIDVSGTVQLHPLEAEWRTANGKPAVTLEGLTIHVEDALKAQTSSSPLKSTTVAQDGSWSVEDVDVTNLNLALVASIDDANGVVSKCGYGLARRKDANVDLLDKPVYVLTNEYLDALVGPTGLTAADLLVDGLLVVQIVDPSLSPLSGAQLAFAVPTVAPIESTETNPLWYLSDDLSDLAATPATGAKGLVLYQPGFGAKEYTAIRDGSTFPLKLAGARKGFVLSVFVEGE